MREDAAEKILRLLDVVAVNVEKHRDETHAAFGRVEARLEHVEVRLEHVEVRLERVEVRLGHVERRLGYVENRVESVETDLRGFRGEFERRIAPFEDRG